MAPAQRKGLQVLPVQLLPLLPQMLPMLPAVQKGPALLLMQQQVLAWPQQAAHPLLWTLLLVVLNGSRTNHRDPTG